MPCLNGSGDGRCLKQASRSLEMKLEGLQEQSVTASKERSPECFVSISSSEYVDGRRGLARLK